MDATIRNLLRALQEDPGIPTAKRLVKALERAERGEKILKKPMTRAELRAAVDEDGRVHGIVLVDLGTEIVDSDLDEFNELLSEKLTGTGRLSDIQYRVVDVESSVDHVNGLLIEVSGKVDFDYERGVEEPRRPTP